MTDILYSDFFINFDIHPVTGDLARAVNEVAVKRALRLLIMTNKGERLYDVRKGSSVKQFIFQDFSPQTTQNLQDDIKNCIKNYEPRVTGCTVVATPYEDKDQYSVDIIFTVINNPDPQTLNLTLERIR